MTITQQLIKESRFGKYYPDNGDITNIQKARQKCGLDVNVGVHEGDMRPFRK